MAGCFSRIFRPKGGGAESGVTLFGLVSTSPSDRSTINLFANGGVVVANMVPGRPDDKFGVSVLYARFSDRLRNFQQDQIAFGTPAIVQDYETNLELNYVFQIVNCWTAQPFATYVWHPNGDATKNALVTGLRTIIRY